MRKFVLLAVLLLLSACGTAQGDRALSGAAIGAGIGALVSVPCAGCAAPLGAALGAGAGLAFAVVTPPSWVDLGPTPWNRMGYRVGGTTLRY